MKALVLDLGLGNLLSIRRGLERAGAEVVMLPKITSMAPSKVEKETSKADVVVLPGVGAFGDGMEALRCFSPILEGIVRGEGALLGICLGMQLLFERSEEGGKHIGLGLLKGEVVRLPRGVKVPHMGWNSIRKTKESRLLSGISGGEYFYFVHSYYCLAQRQDVVAECDYGRIIPAAVEWRNIYGTQFHPEKSGKMGVTVLRNFLEAARR